MSIRKSAVLFGVALSMAAFMSGCSSSTKEGGSPSDVPKVDEKTCAQCHGSSYNSQSGMPIYSEYVQSKHFLNSIGEVVGCQDCHGGGAMHNGVGPIPFPNPDKAGKCFGCHKNEFLGLYNANGKPTAIQAAHFRNMTANDNNVSSAMYVTTNFENGCTACHEPHNPLNGRGADQRKAWAQSGHGNINNAPFADEAFNQNTSCIRCHTSTGYSNFLAGTTGGSTAPWSDPFPTASWAAKDDKGREVLTCRTCHVNDSFAVKGAPAFTAPYNSNKNPKAFPNVGESNLCIACHSGRENADSIEAIADFTNASFKNSHYKAGAALMYMASGFDNFTTSTTKFGTGYTSSTTYQKTMTPDNVSVPSFGIAGGVTSTHRKLGTTMINGDSHNAAFFVPGTADANGPCVTCHLNVNGTPDRPATGHSWKIDANAFNQLCVNCHDEEGGVALTGANFQTIFLEEQAVGFTDALGLIQNLFLTKYGIKYDPNAYPYFYDLTKDATGKTAVKDWTRGTKDQKFGKRLMGAAFNLNLLTKDPGSYVHARTFVRRLIYDSVDYLDDKSMNFSVSATAIAYNPTLYTRGAKAYNINAGVTRNGITTYSITTLDPGTSADMAYLLGYNRSGATGGTANLTDAQAQAKAGAWATRDRP